MTEAQIQTPPKEFHVDPTRSRKFELEPGRPACWVAVVGDSREKLELPEARQAAVTWAQAKLRVAGAIDVVQGPVEDDGRKTAFQPDGGTPQNAAVIGPAEYRQLAAEANLAAAKGRQRWVLFVRVRPNEM